MGWRGASIIRRIIRSRMSGTRERGRGGRLKGSQPWQSCASEQSQSNRTDVAGGSSVDAGDSGRGKRDSYPEPPHDPYGSEPVSYDWMC